MGAWRGETDRNPKSAPALTLAPLRQDLRLRKEILPREPVNHGRGQNLVRLGCDVSRLRFSIEMDH
jgi:hypothetical protein